MNNEYIPELCEALKDITDLLEAVKVQDAERDAFNYIVTSYGVPAGFGVCVHYAGKVDDMDGTDGIIIGAPMGRIEVVCEDGHLHNFHPTYDMEYFGKRAEIILLYGMPSNKVHVIARKELGI